MDDPSIPVSEKLQKVRVANLVREYLAAQELQLLNEGGLTDAISSFVDKDDTHGISAYVMQLPNPLNIITDECALRYVDASLKGLMKGAQVKGNIPDRDEDEEDESDPDDIEERVSSDK